MFSPAIPAYLWLWPNVRQTDWLTPVQIAVYLYLLGGSVLIGLRRWNLRQLGLESRGWCVSLIGGTVLILILILGRLATNLPWVLRSLTPQRFVFDIVFYFGMVGLVEELLFRGLTYRVLQEWHGDWLAIGGTALAFGVYHLGWQGLAGGLATLVMGLLFGAIRWRAGGILGLIIIHGLLDMIAVELWPNVGPDEISQIQVTNFWLGTLADGLTFALVLYLLFYPRLGGTGKGYPWFAGKQ